MLVLFIQTIARYSHFVVGRYFYGGFGFRFGSGRGEITGVRGTGGDAGDDYGEVYFGDAGVGSVIFPFLLDFSSFLAVLRERERERERRDSCWAGQ